MIYRRQWLLGIAIVLIGLMPLATTSATSSGNRQVFLPLILEKPVPVPTNPTLALFTTQSDDNDTYPHTLYATTLDGTITHLARNNGSSYAFSPNGRYLTYSHEYGLNDLGYELLDLVEGTHRRLVQTGQGAFEWAPDNLRFAYNLPFANGNLYVSDINSTTGQVITNFQHLGFRWLRNAPYLVFNWNDDTQGGLYRAAVEGPGIIPILTSDKEITLLEVLRDDRIVYLETDLSDTGDNLFVINPDGTEQIRLTNDPPSAKGDFYISPQQGLITYQVYYPSTQRAAFYILTPDGEQLSKIQNPCRPQDPCDIRSLAWTPDERAIYYTLQYDLTTRTDLFRAEVIANPIPELIQEDVIGSTIQISPDGRYLAFVVPAANAQRTLLFRDLITGTDRAIATGDDLIFRGWRP